MSSLLVPIVKIEKIASIFNISAKRLKIKIKEMFNKSIKDLRKEFNNEFINSGNM